MVGFGTREIVQRRPVGPAWHNTEIHPQSRLQDGGAACCPRYLYMLHKWKRLGVLHARVGLFTGNQNIHLPNSFLPTPIAARHFERLDAPAVTELVEEMREAGRSVRAEKA